MKECTRKAGVLTLLLTILIFSILPSAFCQEGSSTDQSGTDQKYYIGSAVNTGTDTGYSEKNEIEEKDPHFGWRLGRFYITGFTRVTEDSNGYPVFLKNVGDKVGMYFTLEQNINSLNGNTNLAISDDSNGYDAYFGIGRTDFGRGMLIIRKTDYENNTTEPQLYQSYLTGVTQGANTEVNLYEEGDYEVALDYEVKATTIKVPLVNWEIFPGYSNYQILFRFSVRNGNCMVYPFDVVTGEELTNTSVTENGFRLDLANSHYLVIDIKKEVLLDGADGLTEDTRFNKPAKDGNEYTDEGVYTITVTNSYTKQETTKKIYVGTDDVLKAYTATGLPISEIREMISEGATVKDDGTIVKASAKASEEDRSPITSISSSLSDNTSTPTSTSTTDPQMMEASSPSEDSTPSKPTTLVLLISVVFAAIIAFLLLAFLRRHKKSTSSSFQPRDVKITPDAEITVSTDDGTDDFAGNHGGVSNKHDTKSENEDEGR